MKIYTLMPAGQAVLKSLQTAKGQVNGIFTEQCNSWLDQCYKDAICSADVVRLAAGCAQVKH